MSNIYAPCVCGSGKKFKFCCYAIQKSGGVLPATEAHTKFPVVECRINSSWKTDGISPVIVVREVSPTQYVFISYLIDMWCLGLKDTMIKLGASKWDLEAIYRRGRDMVPISYQDARSMILGGIDFARKLDIPPHASWKGMPSSFIESEAPYEKKFSFGNNGVPYYFQGPYDHKLFDIDEVLRKVEQAKGYYTLAPL